VGFQHRRTHNTDRVHLLFLHGTAKRWRIGAVLPPIGAARCDNPAPPQPGRGSGWSGPDGLPPRGRNRSRRAGATFLFGGQGPRAITGGGRFRRRHSASPPISSLQDPRQAGPSTEFRRTGGKGGRLGFRGRAACGWDPPKPHTHLAGRNSHVGNPPGWLDGEARAGHRGNSRGPPFKAPGRGSTPLFAAGKGGYSGSSARGQPGGSFEGGGRVVAQIKTPPFPMIPPRRTSGLLAAVHNPGRFLGPRLRMVDVGAGPV